MKKHNLAFIDLETTGFDPNKQEIIQIGCLVAKQIPRPGKGPTLEFVEEFEIKVKPEHLETADPEALRINGYNDAEWIFAASLPQALEKLSKAAAGATMVAHNLTFDWQFLDHAFKATGVENKMHYAKIDTIAVAFAKLYHDDRVHKFNLASLAEHLGVKNEKAHTALADVRATYEVYKKLIEL